MDSRKVGGKSYITFIFYFRILPPFPTLPFLPHSPLHTPVNLDTGLEVREENGKDIQIESIKLKNQFQNTDVISFIILILSWMAKEEYLYCILTLLLFVFVFLGVPRFTGQIQVLPSPGSGIPPFTRLLLQRY